MAERKALMLVCTVIVIGLLVPPVLAVQKAPGDMVLFCTAGGLQEHPDIDGDMVVWEDGRDGNKDIYSASRPGSGEQITGDTALQARPSVSGDYIVWEDNRNMSRDIYLYRYSTGTTVPLTDDPADQWMPVVHGGYVVWYDTREGSADICLHNIGTGQETYLDCSPATRWKPALSERYVVWEEDAGGGDIWTYDMQTGQKRQITWNSAEQAYPAISGTRIVWEDYRNGQPDIYLYDLGSSQEYRITDNPAEQVSPAIDGGIIAWEDKRGGLWDIYLYDFDLEVEMPVCTAENEQLFPSVSGDRIVWQDKRSGEWKVYIFTYTGGAPPEAKFSVDPATGTTPLTVRFTDQSTGSPEEWEWEFGDGDWSTEQNPVHTYESPGEYTVSLEVRSQFGSDTATETDLIRADLPEPPSADFSATPASGGAPLAVQFTDESTNSPDTWLWNFGDGATSDDQNPEHTYAAVGTYSVSLTAGNAAGSTEITKPGYITVIEPPAASFMADTRNGTAPLTVRFTDASTGDVTAWSWRFGDGGISSEQNPEHRYLAAGTYTVSLEVKNSAGSDTETKSDYIMVIERPVAAFTVNTVKGVAPLAVRFTDASTGVPVSWSWNFGDGGTSADRSPEHTYGSPGTYTVSLTVANGAGENTTTKTGHITVFEPLVAGFEANTTGGRVPLSVRFTDQSTGSPEAWRWEFGDGSLSNDQNPTHTYQSAGIYTLTLTVENDLGTDTRKMNGYITVTAPPVAGFSANVTGGRAPLTVLFEDTSEGSPLTCSWAFGDGKSSTAESPVHVYQAPGTYTVSLTVANDVGENTTVETGYITVRESLAAGFTANATIGAAPLAVRFEDASVGGPGSWSWDFGDGRTSAVPDPVHVFETPGIYTVNLKVSNGSDHSTQSLQIRAFGPPTAGFSAAPLSGTAPIKVTFNDTSVGEPFAWLWSFGDGGASTDRHPSHTYTAAGNYTVNLTAENAAGRSTVVKTGYISVRPAAATPAPTQTQPPASGGGGGGGGGGGSAWINPGWNTPAPTSTSTSIPTPTAVPGAAEPGRLHLGETGLVEESVRISSSDGIASLAIAEGVRAVDADGDPLAAVTLEHLSPVDVPPVPGVGTYAFAGYACIAGPEGAAFSPPVTLSFNFTEEQWDAVYNDSGQNGLLVQWYNRSADAWEEVPTTVHPETRSVEAVVLHFSQYALFVEVPGGGAAQVVAADTNSQPQA
ncbi:MAG: PKD domain-containing protein, partial [Methanoculleus sp.]|nr:PKD domain-containing protein [Methanoculleus sp.]